MGKRRRSNGFVGPRLMGLLASLFFSVPTAVFVWLAVNKELAYWGGFLNSAWLFGSIIIFAAIALLMPGLFPGIMGGIWHWIVRLLRWWGW